MCMSEKLLTRIRSELRDGPLIQAAFNAPTTNWAAWPLFTTSRDLVRRYREPLGNRGDHAG